MSSNIEYLLQLHRNGVITNDDLRQGIRALNEPNVKEPAKVQDVSLSPALENLRKKCRERKKRKQQANKYEGMKRKVIHKLKQVLQERNIKNNSNVE